MTEFTSGSNGLAAMKTPVRQNTREAQELSLECPSGFAACKGHCGLQNTREAKQQCFADDRHREVKLKRL